MFTGKVEIDGDEIRGGEVRQDFIYLCHQEHIPGDIKAGDFFSKALQIDSNFVEARKNLDILEEALSSNEP